MLETWTIAQPPIFFFPTPNHVKPFVAIAMRNETMNAMDSHENKFLCEMWNALMMICHGRNEVCQCHNEISVFLSASLGQLNATDEK